MRSTPKNKKPSSLNDVLMEDLDNEFLDEYIDWLVDEDDDCCRKHNSIDDEWDLAMADLEELGFNEKID